MSKPKREMACNGTGGCMTCPFAVTDESEQVQNYGCLPEPYQIIDMKKKSGHNWACHDDETVVCGGLAKRLKDDFPSLSIKEGNLISYDTWYFKGEKEALEEADKRGGES